MKRILLALLILTLMALAVSCGQSEPIVGGSCGTVSPDSRDECCVQRGEGNKYDVVNQKCITVEKTRLDEAKEYCSGENVAAVYLCQDNIKVVSSLLGGGSTYYKDGNVQFSCPVVGPDYITEECKTVMDDSTCTEVCD